ncbi:uncharacterized protein LOC134230879 [Saccostrea cucullata]|uniref:uncharacterized protein LOC134230879 n=1 Tax=Saccostrea cuccullata TaxID=36930 RepID=UPI002ED13FC6
MNNSGQVCKIIVIISCVINLLLAIVFGFLLALNWENVGAYFRFKTDTLQQEIIGNVSGDGELQTKDSVCFSCDYLGNSVSVNETLYDKIVTTDCQHKLCCIKNSVIHDFVQATLNQNNDKGNNSSIRDSFTWWRNRPHSAHLYLDRDNSVTKENKLRWITDDSYGTAFAHDIELMNGTHMRIKKGGIYFIYSSTTFDHTGQDTVETLYQSIIKYHPMLPKTGDVDLIFSKFGGSPESDRHHTNFLAGVFELQKDYRIASPLSQSGHKFLDKSSVIKNYFGIYKL